MEDKDDFFGIKAPEYKPRERDEKPGQFVENSEPSSSNLFDEQYFLPVRNQEESTYESSFSRQLKPSEDDDFFTEQMLQQRSAIEPDANRAWKEPKRLPLEEEHPELEEEELEKSKNGLDAIFELIDPVWKFNDDALLDMMTERVLYEDESIVAIDKPYQMAYSGAKSGQAQLDRLLTRLAQRIAPESGKLHVVRTLDKQTTGIVLFAKNLERQAQLRDAYEDGRVEQRYRCLVKGIPDEEKAKISIPLVKLIKGRDMHLEPVKNPRTELNVYNVSTEYHIVNSNSTNCALLGATVSKDISHQIRAHLSYGAGCTLIGDKKYNLKDRNVPPRISPTAMTRLNLKPNQFRHLPMFMHLNQLLIPRGGPGSKYISIRAPVPHAFYYVLNKLRLLKK